VPIGAHVAPARLYQTGSVTRDTCCNNVQLLQNCSNESWTTCSNEQMSSRGRCRVLFPTRARAGPSKNTRPAATNTATRARRTGLHAGHGALFTDRSRRVLATARRRCRVLFPTRARAGPSQNTGPAAPRADLRRQNTVAAASRAAAAANAAVRPREITNHRLLRRRGGRDRAYKYECGAPNPVSVFHEVF